MRSVSVCQLMVSWIMNTTPINALLIFWELLLWIGLFQIRFGIIVLECLMFFWSINNQYFLRLGLMIWSLKSSGLFTFLWLYQSVRLTIFSSWPNWLLPRYPNPYCPDPWRLLFLSFFERDITRRRMFQGAGTCFKCVQNNVSCHKI